MIKDQTKKMTNEKAIKTSPDPTPYHLWYIL